MIIYFLVARDPNCEHRHSNCLHEWPRYSADHKHYLELNIKHLDDYSAHSARGRGHREEACAFWATHIPKLLETSGMIHIIRCNCTNKQIKYCTVLHCIRSIHCGFFFFILVFCTFLQRSYTTFEICTTKANQDPSVSLHPSTTPPAQLSCHQQVRGHPQRSTPPSHSCWSSSSLAPPAASRSCTYHVSTAPRPLQNKLEFFDCKFVMRFRAMWNMNAKLFS